MTMINPAPGYTVTPRYSQIDVSWNAQAGVTSAVVRANISGRQVLWTTYCPDPVTGIVPNFVTLHNMDQGTTYEVTAWLEPGVPGGTHASKTVTTSGPKPGTAMPTVSSTNTCPPPSPLAPVVTTDAATSVTSTTATLNGTVNPEGAATTAHFDYGLDASYGTSTADDTSPGSGRAAMPLSAALTGLLPSTTYHYRTVATNSVGTTLGPDRTLVTAAPPAAPVVTTDPATGVSSSGATLHGTVNPGGADAMAHFNYGPDTSYGTATTAVDEGAGNSPVPLSTAISGLNPGTTYHYQTEAANSLGDVLGPDAAFTTSASSSFPDASTTGTTGALTAVPGSATSGPGWSYSGGVVTCNSPGGIVQNLDITGEVHVLANMTLRNCRVTAAGASVAAVWVGDSSHVPTGVTVDHCEIRGSNAGSGRAYRGISTPYGNATGTVITSNNIYWTAQSIHNFTDGTVQGNYVHDMGMLSADHVECVYYGGGGSGAWYNILGNTFLNQVSQTGAIYLTSDWGAATFVKADGNLVAGGGYSIYGGTEHAATSHILITNNAVSRRFFANGGYWGWIAYWSTSDPGNVISGNYWYETGLPVSP